MKLSKKRSIWGRSIWGRACFYIFLTIHFIYDKTNKKVAKTGTSPKSTFITINSLSQAGWSDDVISTALVHEMTHSFTDLFGFDDGILFSSYVNDALSPEQLKIAEYLVRQDITRKYQEATAITVETQFRKEMGFGSRSALDGLIGVNDYGQFPNAYTNNPQQVANVLGDVYPVYGHIIATTLKSHSTGIVDYMMVNYGY